MAYVTVSLGPVFLAVELRSARARVPSDLSLPGLFQRLGVELDSHTDLMVSV